MSGTLQFVPDNHIKARNVKGAYAVLVIQTVLMMTAIALISSSVHCKNVKPCELQTALDFIYLKYNTHPCKYNAIKEMSSGFLGLGIILICWNAILFLLTMCICWWKFGEKKQIIAVLILYIIIIIGTFAIFIVNLEKYIRFMKEREAQRDVDYIQLENEMMSALEQNFRSDNTSSNDLKSSAWNRFFIEHNCCAVHDVMGTTNDFDNTPWCTTSGSCQDTSSQIPRTCCKDVTLNNYTSAPSTCHASVNSGTYKPNCMDQVRKRSVKNIDEYQLGILSLSLLFSMILQILEVTIMTVLLFLPCCGCKNEK
ncbi:uncharacterized protein LOC111126690 isoform X1 [Crassostrea virginica]